MSNPSSLTAPTADWLDAPTPALTVREATAGADEERPDLLTSGAVLGAPGHAGDWVLMAELESLEERLDAVVTASAASGEANSASSPAVRTDLAAEDASQAPEAIAVKPFAPCVMPEAVGERLDGRWSKDIPDRAAEDQIIVIDDPVPESPFIWTTVREELRDEAGTLTGYRDVLSYGDSFWFSEYDANFSFVASGFESANCSGRAVREIVRNDDGQLIAYRDNSEYRDALGNWSTGTRETLLDVNGAPTGFRDTGSGGGGDFTYTSFNEYDAGFNLLASSYSDSNGYHFTTVRVDLTNDDGQPAGWRFETTGGAPGYSFERVEIYGPVGSQFSSEYSDSNGATSFYSQVNNFDERGNPAGYTVTSSGSFGGSSWSNTAIYDAYGNYLGGDSWSFETSPTDAGGRPDEASTGPTDSGEASTTAEGSTPPDQETPDVDGRLEPQVIVCWLDPPDSVDLPLPGSEEPQIAVCWLEIQPEQAEEPLFMPNSESPLTVVLAGVNEFSSEEPLAA